MDVSTEGNKMSETQSRQIHANDIPGLGTSSVPEGEKTVFALFSVLSNRFRSELNHDQFLWCRVGERPSTTQTSQPEEAYF